MRIETLNSFATLVTTGSYPAAAEVLFVSPTTLHSHVKSLEDQLGMKLVSFEGKRLELTPAGNRLYLFAEEVLQQYEKLELDISGSAKPDATRLRVMSLNGPSNYLLPQVARQYQSEHPEVLVSIRARDVGESLSALASGQADLAFMNDGHVRQIPAGFTYTEVYEDSLALVIRADYYAAPDRDLLNRYPLALQEGYSLYRQYVQRWAADEGITLNAVFEHSAFDGLLAYALQGGCVAMMGGYVPKYSHAAGLLRVLQLDNFELRRKILAVHAKSPGVVVNDFIDCFRNTFGTN